MTQNETNTQLFSTVYKTFKLQLLLAPSFSLLPLSPAPRRLANGHANPTNNPFHDTFLFSVMATVLSQFRNLAISVLYQCLSHSLRRVLLHNKKDRSKRNKDKKTKPSVITWACFFSLPFPSHSVVRLNLLSSPSPSSPYLSCLQKEPDKLFWNLCNPLHVIDAIRLCQLLRQKNSAVECEARSAALECKCDRALPEKGKGIVRTLGWMNDTSIIWDTQQTKLPCCTTGHSLSHNTSRMLNPHLQYQLWHMLDLHETGSTLERSSW